MRSPLTVLVRHPPSYPRERAYAFDAVLSEGLGLRWTSLPEGRGDVELSLAGATGRVILPDIVFSGPEPDWPGCLQLPERPLESIEGALVCRAVGAGSVPVLFGRRGSGGGWLEETGDGISLGLDVFGTAFALLSRIEELNGSTRDAHGRFPASASLGHRLGFLDRPLVDEHVELLRAVLEQVFPGLVSRRHPYSEDVTHDIDFVDGRRVGAVQTARSAARNLFGDRAPSTAARRLASIPLRPLVGPRCDVFNTFADLMQLSEERGLRSTFFFIAGRAPGGLHDDNYEIGEPWLRAILRSIAGRGHAVGLHGSYQSFASAEQLGSELAALRGVLRGEGIDDDGLGCRQHFLRFDAAVTWPAQAEAGLAYDSTMCFADAPGFRSGTCREHPVFDVARRERLPLRERPLTLMDSTVLDRQYLDLDTDEAARLAEQLKRCCRRVGGTFRLLWHNTMLVTPAQRRLYREILSC
jgi:hypothetical protein